MKNFLRSQNPLRDGRLEANDAAAQFSPLTIFNQPRGQTFRVKSSGHQAVATLAIIELALLTAHLPAG